ncbi:MAG: LD-carboxypeptidase [Clostridia bacterium]|nr:LD-carboxypeptidase [Clostridia bacterium]MBR6574913.1 LD-carboxypeptidase [Clostridia bacterium]
MIRPKSLQPGDRLAVLCGSSPTSKTSDELMQAVRDMGLEPVLYPSATAKHGFLSGVDAIRAADINAAFADPSIKGIVCTRGGYGFHRILPLLDWKTIKKNPKIFGGYSDVTAMLNALNQICGMESYHMPMVGAWGDGLDEYSAPFVKSMLFGEPVEYVNPEGSPITTLVPGKAKGRLCGGNLSLLAASLGTPYEIDTKGKILFIEEIGERPYKVDGMLTHLRNAGKFDDAAGIILGGFTNCADKEGVIGGLSLEDIYGELIVPAGKPTISGVVCGHCSPTMSLPMGRLFKMDAAAGTFGPVKK